MTQNAPEAATPQSCPTCGALPCDQVNTPEKPEIAPSVGFLAVIFGLLLIAASPILAACVLGWISMWSDILGLHHQSLFD